MKNKAILVLIEINIMFLIVAIVSIFCLKAFHWSYNTSREGEIIAKAFTEIQNIAEELKASKGDFDEVKVDGKGYYIIVNKLDSKIDGLGQAKLSGWFKNNECFTTIDVAWQE